MPSLWYKQFHPSALLAFPNLSENFRDSPKLIVVLYFLYQNAVPQIAIPASLPTFGRCCGDVLLWMGAGCRPQRLSRVGSAWSAGGVKPVFKCNWHLTGLNPMDPELFDNRLHIGYRYARSGRYRQGTFLQLRTRDSNVFDVGS